MRNDQNFEQHWRSDFRMSQDTFRDIVRVVQPALEKRDTQFRRAIPVEKQLHYGDFRQATLFVLLQKHLQSANQRLFKLLESCAEMLRSSTSSTWSLRWYKYPHSST